MKKIKRILSLGLCLAVAFTFTSCGNPYSNVDFDKYIKVAKYKGVEINPIKVKVTAKEVNKEIKARLEAKKTTENVKTGVVKDGSTINIDYVGSINGVKFDGGSEKGADLTIGSGKMIPGFEESLVGAKVGTTKNIKVKFPNNYSKEELAGKNAVFAVKINTMQKDTIPPLDEKFVKQNSDVKTVAEYKKLVEKEMIKKRKDELEEQQRVEVWTKIVTASKMKKDDKKKEMYPQEQLDRVVEETKKTYENLAKQSNMSLSDFVSQNFGMDEKTFNSQLDELAKIMVKEELVLYYIAEKEDISVSRSEYKEYIKNTLAKYGYDEESYEEANNGKSYEKVVGKEVIEAEALKEKVQKYIIENAKEKVVKKSAKKKKK